MLKGVDLSNYQASTPAGFDFYILKASEGVGFKDARLDEHYNAAAAMDKPYGFYHYARPDLGNTPEAEADYFLSLVGHHAQKCIFALDWEGASLNYSASWALAWLNSVYQKTGVRPLFYCSTGFLNGGKYADIAAANYGLWVAQYNDKLTLSPSSGWNVWAIWQNTDNINGLHIDGNIFNGTRETWNMYAGAQAELKPQPTETKKELKKEKAGSVYRFYNRKTDAHFYTPKYSKAVSLNRSEWKYEGVAWVEEIPGTGVSCLTNPKETDFVFTTNDAEIEYLKKSEWKCLGGLLSTGGKVPVYRLFDSKNSKHLFTVSERETSFLIKSGWNFEGVAFYAKEK